MVTNNLQTRSNTQVGASQESRRILTLAPYGRVLSQIRFDRTSSASTEQLGDCPTFVVSSLLVGTQDEASVDEHGRCPNLRGDPYHFRAATDPGVFLPKVMDCVHQIQGHPYMNEWGRLFLWSPLFFFLGVFKRKPKGEPILVGPLKNDTPT